jgi:hypothetical protein
MLLRIEGGVITNINPDAPEDFDEFEVDGLRIDDFLFVAVDNLCPVDSSFTDITGVLVYSFSNFKLTPRAETDFGTPQCVPY